MQRLWESAWSLLRELNRKLASDPGSPFQKYSLKKPSTKHPVWEGPTGHLTLLPPLCGHWAECSCPLSTPPLGPAPLPAPGFCGGPTSGGLQGRQAQLCHREEEPHTCSLLSMHPDPGGPSQAASREGRIPAVADAPAPGPGGRMPTVMALLLCSWVSGRPGASLLLPRWSCLILLGVLALEGTSEATYQCSTARPRGACHTQTQR